jgi:uncharacterized protein (TIGR02145 family)
MKEISKESQKGVLRRISSSLAILSVCFVFTTFAVYLYSPVFKTNAAEESVDVTVNVNPVISLTLDKNALNFDITPTSAGVFDSDSIVATVDTNSTGGYELYFSSEDSGTALTSLVSEATIASDFNSAVTSSSMAANKWGYSLDATNFSKIPALADQAKIKDLDHIPSSLEKDTIVTIGTKIDSALPSGTYSKKVVFSAIAHDSLTPEPIVSMQDFECLTTAPINTTVTLVDSRDGNTYRVRKLADGKCWMIDNLRITNKTITSDDSNLSEGESYTIPDGFWIDEETTQHNDRSHIAYVDPTYGGYYSFNVATAGWWSTYDNGMSYPSYPNTSPKDICPKGWRLPTGGSSDADLGILGRYYNTSALLRGDPNFILAGNAGIMGEYDGNNNYIYTGVAVGGFEYGHYWTSTTGGDLGAQTLRLTENAVWGLFNTDAYRTHVDGLSVRCLSDAVEPTYPDWSQHDTPVTTMQQFSCSSIRASQYVTVTDSRDGTDYWVGKLADGNCWMLENLRISGREISSADSNLPQGTSFEIPASSLSSFDGLSGPDGLNGNYVYVDSTNGGYYTYYAATAGWGEAGVDGDSPRDICPKGWRLPVGSNSGSGGEYEALYNFYNTPALIMGEPNFIATGYISVGSDGAEVFTTSPGFYWSSTAYSGYDSQYDTSYEVVDTLLVFQYSVTPHSGMGKQVGNPMRCMAK